MNDQELKSLKHARLGVFDNNVQHDYIDQRSDFMRKLAAVSPTINMAVSRQMFVTLAQHWKHLGGP